MKKTLLMLAMAAFVAATAGSLVFKAQNVSVYSRPDDRDPELATTVRRMTNRSLAGLKERRAPRGGLLLDLQGRFQDLALVKLDPEGDPAVGCVSSIDEANRFFGRNLETGEVYPSSPTDTEEYLRTKHAAPSDMTIDEFLQYKEMIRRAAPRLIGEGRSTGSTDNAASGSSSSFTSGLTANTTVINIVNNDGAGEGFNDATAMAPEGGNNGTTLGAQRLNLFNFAATIWAANLDSTVPINIKAQFDSLAPCTTSGGVLGSAGTTNIFRDFTGAEFPGTWYPAALANKITGTDGNGATAEINATFNSDVDTGCLGTGTRFYYGFDNTTPSGRVNLLVVLLHEFGHGMGFQTFTNGSTGIQAGSTPGTPNSGFTDIYARHILDRTTGKFWNQMTDTERQASALNNGNLLWDGPDVDLASGSLTQGRDAANGRVQLYAPIAYESGSSVSHWDKAAAPNLLMEPVINRGLPIDLDLTRQQMRDIGWYRDVNGDRIPDTISNVTVSGTSLLAGSSAQVTWVNGGGFAGNVTVELSTDGGVTYPTTLATNVANTGSLAFTVPSQPTTQGRIRVREYNFVSPVGTTASVFTIGTTAAGPSSIAFGAGNFNIGEAGGHIDLSVIRTGDASGAATVSYTTFDQTAGAGHASQASDYQISEGTLNFNPGETSKIVTVLIVDDKFVEGNETIGLTLSNATGTNVTLGSPSTATVTILDNDTVTSTTNPHDDARFFVRQQYLDFLNREPDQSGWDFWTNTIISCGADAACTEVHRINVSAAFFLSKEFQNTGYLAYLTHRSAFGPNAGASPAPVLYNTFMQDVQELGKGYVDLQAGADQVLEANKVAYFNEFVARPEFLAKYPSSLTNQQYVDNLLISANLPSDPSLVGGLNGGTMTRATVLRSVAESSTLQTRELNGGFVTMEYFGYLRRDPDTGGFNFWRQKLIDFNGNYIQAEMVKAFIESTEDRQRFGAP
jgi:hypothetical protein